MKLPNYIPEVHKQFCDLIDSVSVKMLMLVLGCSVGRQSVGQGSLPCISTLHLFVLYVFSIHEVAALWHFFEVVVFVVSRIQAARLRGIKALTALDGNRVHSLNDLIAISLTLGQNIVLTSIYSNVSLVRSIYRRRKRQQASYNVGAWALSSFIAPGREAP